MDNEPKIKLKVIDMESGKIVYCNYVETREWQWDDPNILRVINGTRVTSWDKLMEIIRYQDEKGTPELVIYVVPRFMLLGGG